MVQKEVQKESKLIVKHTTLSIVNYKLGIKKEPATIHIGQVFYCLLN